MHVLCRCSASPVGEELTHMHWIHLAPRPTIIDCPNVGGRVPLEGECFENRSAHIASQFVTRRAGRWEGVNYVKNPRN